jgi:hypothetical protein
VPTNVNISVSLYVASAPVAARCIVQLDSNGTDAAHHDRSALTNPTAAAGTASAHTASGALDSAFTFYFIARDIDSLELQRESLIGSAGFRMYVLRDGVPPDPLSSQSTAGSWTLEYTGVGGRYRVRFVPAKRGDYRLRLSYAGEPFGEDETVLLTVGCAPRKQPLRGGLCGCEPGSLPDPAIVAGGATTCVSCFPATYKTEPGDGKCDACFAQATSASGAVQRAQCDCLPGYFRMSDNLSMPHTLAWESTLSCVGCPEGATCNATGVTVERLPVSRGYWRKLSYTPRVRRCLGGTAGAEAACLGGDNVSSQCASGRDQSSPYCAGWSHRRQPSSPSVAPARVPHRSPSPLLTATCCCC